MEFYSREATRSYSCQYTLVQNVWVRHHKDTEGKVVPQHLQQRKFQVVLSEPNQTKLQHLTKGKAFVFWKNLHFDIFKNSSFCSKRGYRLLFWSDWWNVCSTELIPGKFHTSYSDVDHCYVFILTMEHCLFKTFCEIKQKKLPEGNKTETQVISYLM